MTAPAPSPAPAGAVDRACAALRRAVLAHDRALPERLAALLAADPAHVRGWALKAIFAMTLARAELLPAATQAAETARAGLRSGAGRPGDAAYVRAAEHLTRGDWTAAIAALDSAIDRDGADSLAVKLAHSLRFMLGDAEGMARSIDGALTRIDAAHPDFGFLLGCRAFALEETFRFGEAERSGRAALEREPTDAWGLHAVSHVHEMTGRAGEGLAWIAAHPAAVESCNNFRFHLSWHEALFRLELDDAAGALSLYDGAIRAERSDDFRDIANAASLLRRLELAGLAVGDRWEELGDLCARRVADRSLVFADLHYVMALAGAGRIDSAETLARSLAAAPARSLEQTRRSRIGASLAAALIDHEQGRFAACAETMLSLRPEWPRLGGSHAQRDIFEQVMLDAMVRAGHPQARALLLTRLARRGGRNAFARLSLDRLAATPRRRAS
ncbi:MAG: tetratricopeptide repeat protein [Methylobacteriaceae bacterium]|nr:tetratricopeptide repeat protein [Methylobacteriaceae bacterium]